MYSVVEQGSADVADYRGEEDKGDDGVGDIVIGLELANQISLLYSFRVFEMVVRKVLRPE